MLAAIVNGALREGVLVPRMGENAAKRASTLLLTAAILALTWLLIGWIAPDSAGAALLIGGVWLLLTLGFEFLAGHYLFKDSWSDLLEEYDVLSGRIWIIIPIITLVAPL